MRVDIRDLKVRQTDTHGAVLSLKRDAVQDSVSVAHVQVQIDRLRDDVDRLKRRLDLGDA